jgi:CHAT domain-containing protein
MLVMNEGGSVTSDGEIPTVKGGVFFGDRHPISYYQSITALTLFRTVSQRKSTGERVLVIADPIFEMADTRVIELAQGAPTEKPAEITLMGPFRKMQDGGAGLCRLPMTSRLAGTLATLFPGKADVYTGLKASKNTFLEDISPRLEEYGLVVMATHGYFDEENPGILEPILVLTMVPPGTDGILRMSEVLGLKMNADLVALVACQSGLGKRISGEGAMGMGRAFQFGGARSVLTSLWSISEYASVSMVESFFGHIKNGKAKLEALQAARAEIRSKGFDHPFFWAPFILVGEVD